MVYLLGNDFQHLHDSCAQYCLNVGCIDGFLILNKETSDKWTLYASHAGEEKPLKCAATQGLCRELVKNIMMKHVMSEPHVIVDIDDLYPKECTRSADEILSDMCQTLVDAGYETLVEEFESSLGSDSVKINIDQVCAQVEYNDTEQPADVTTNIAVDFEEERLETPTELEE